MKNHTIQSKNYDLFNSNMKHGSPADISLIFLKSLGPDLCLYGVSTLYMRHRAESVWKETFRTKGGGQVFQKGVSLRLLFTEQNHILESQCVTAMQEGLHTPSSYNMC